MFPVAAKLDKTFDRQEIVNILRYSQIIVLGNQAVVIVVRTSFRRFAHHCGGVNRQ